MASCRREQLMLMQLIPVASCWILSILSLAIHPIRVTVSTTYTAHYAAKALIMLGGNAVLSREVPCWVPTVC